VITIKDDQESPGQW